MELRRPSEPWTVLEDGASFRWIPAGQGQRFGPRAHQRHVPAYDVEQLRQLIKAGDPEESANPGDAGIVQECYLWPLFAFPHGAELVHPEGSFALPHSQLHKEGRTAIKSDR